MDVFIAVFEPYRDNGQIESVTSSLEDMLRLYPKLEFDIKHSPWRDDEVMNVVTAAKWKGEILVVYKYEIEEPA